MRTKWLRLAMVISLSLMITYAAYAAPSAPSLPLTLDGAAGAISWGPATVSFGAPANVIEYYEWELRLNGAPTPKTFRANTTVTPPAAATWDGTNWNDDLDNGSFGTITPLEPGIYQLAVRAYDLQDSPTVQGDWRTLDLNVYPLTPVVTVVEEVWDPDGTYNISWTPDQTAVVEDALVEWTFDGWTNTYSSGWITNTGAYNTGAIPAALFWDAVTVRVTTRDSQSLLTSTPGTTTYNPVVWAPNWISVNTGGAPDWIINYGYANPVDVDYFLFKLYATFNGASTNITQGIEDTDKNFSVGFNPVTNSTLQNIYGHNWVMSIGAWDIDNAEHSDFAASGFPLTLASMGTISMTSAADANPWVFHVTYHDPYNDLLWATTPGGYLDFVNLLFDYQAFGWTETERPTPVWGLPGEIDLTVYPATDLVDHAYYNKYRNWRVTASPGLTCDVVVEEHLAASSSLDFTTVCPPFDAPAPGFSEYLDGSYYQVPEYPTAIDGKIWQGVSSGTPIRTTWVLPQIPASFYGNTDYLRSFVDWDVSTDNSTFGDFASDTRTFDWADNTENLPNRTNLTAPAGTVRFYNVNVNMQYDNFGDGIGNYANVSVPALIDQFQVDNYDPGPATGDTIVQDPVTMTYGNPWVFNFTTPNFPDFEQYRTQLTKSAAAGTLNGSFMVPIPPNSPETWTVTEGMWDNQAAWVSNPFGTYNFYVDTYDNTVPDREMYDDPIAFSFPYTVYEALGEVKDLLGVANHVSIEFLYMDRVRAGWQAVNHKPFGLDPNRIHYVAELYYYNEALMKWLLVDETDEVYQYDPVAGDPPIASPNMYADFNAGDYDFPAGQYRVRVNSYYDDPFTTDARGDGLSDIFNIVYEGVTMAAPTWDAGYANILWVDPTVADPVLDMMEYEVMVAGSNGLLYMVRVPAATLSIPVAMSTWWPDANVYEASYVAYVRGVDNIGRWSDWSIASAPYLLELPDFSAASFSVVDSNGAAPANPSTLRNLFVEIAEYTTSPTNFINWNKDLVTFQVKGAYTGDAAGDLDVVAVNNGVSSVQIPVGEVGKWLSYTFSVDMFYDGVLVTQLSAPTAGPYVVDLKGPAAVTFGTPAYNRAPYSWDFSWTPAAAASPDDAAYGYEVLIEKTEGPGGAVTASKLIDNGVLTAITVLPENLFEDIFGHYKVTVIPYDLLGNKGAVEYVVFEYAAPDKTIASVYLVDSEITWTAATEAVAYEVFLDGDNGLEKLWPVSSYSSALAQDFDWAVDFAGQNIYTGWWAYVRAYDIDGNAGAWAKAPLTMALPEVSFLDFTVTDILGTALTNLSTVNNVDEVLVKWNEFTPSNIINYNPGLVTFELVVQMSGDSTEKYEVAGINNGTSSINVPVGEAGKEISYHFTVDVFYDGVKLTQVTSPDIFDFTVDLKGPAAVGSPLWTPVRPAPYSWTFSWTPTEPAARYELTIIDLEAADGTVDATLVLSTTLTSITIDPTEYFDDIFGRFSYTIVPFDALGNKGVPNTVDFDFPAPNLTVSGVTLDSTAVGWNAITEAVKYDVELVSQNGHRTWYGLTANSQAIDWAAIFPTANVYTTWQARVKAYDRDGNEGAWSGFTTFAFALPLYTSYPFEVLHLDTLEEVAVDTAINDRQLMAKWLMAVTPPAGFINFDPARVTFDFQVDANSCNLNQFTTWHYSITANTYQDISHIVNVGIEGDVVWYEFYLQPLYDGVPMMNTWEVKRFYLIDLKAPAAPEDLGSDILVSPWEFDWIPGVEEMWYDEEPFPDGGFAGYTFQLQKVDPDTGLVLNNYTLDLEETSTTVNPLSLNWSVFGTYRWRVHAYDVFGNTSVSEWEGFVYTLNALVAPTWMEYELVGEENSLVMDEEEYSNKRTALFFWNTPATSIIGIDMEDVDYVFELMKWNGSAWVNVKAYPLTWNATAMETEVTVGITDETTEYMGRVRVEYRGEHTGWVYSDMFAIDLDRPSEVAGGADYSSTMLEYPMWTFTWDDSAEDTVGIGGFLFILERLEGETTHAVAMLDLPYIAEEEEEGPGDYDYDGIEYWFDEGTGRFVLDMDPFEFVESIDGIFRYTLIPYDNLENMGYPTDGMEFLSEWSYGDEYGTYPFINLYDNWMGEIQDMGWVNNNTYATVSFDIYGLDGYELDFWLDGVYLAEGVDYMLLDAPYGSDMYYLVLLESVRDMMQGDNGSGDLEIYAYVEEDDLVVQFTVDLFGYVYENERTGFGFGRFRPAVDPGFDY